MHNLISSMNSNRSWFDVPVMCLQFEVSRLKRIVFKRKACKNTNVNCNLLDEHSFPWPHSHPTSYFRQCTYYVKGFKKDHTCTGTITAHGPPSNCSSAVCSFSLNTNPVIEIKQTCSSVVLLSNFSFCSQADPPCACKKMTTEEMLVVYNHMIYLANIRRSVYVLQYNVKQFHLKLCCVHFGFWEGGEVQMNTKCT